MVNTGIDLNQPACDSALTDNTSGDQKSNNVLVLECQHIPMRGYVADIQKTDQKLYDQFSSHVSHDGSSMDIKHERPPMELPKFCWLQCDSSVSGPKSSSGTSKEAQKPIAKVVDARMPSKVVDAPKLQCNSTDSNRNKNCNTLTISADIKGKGRAHVDNELAPQTGFENSLVRESLSQGILKRTTDGKDTSRSADDEAFLRATSAGNGKTTKSSHHKNRKSAGIAIRSRRKRVNREKGNNANEIYLMNKQATLEAQRASVWTNRVRTDVVEISHGSCSGSSSGSKALVVPLPNLNELNVQPSEDNDNNVLVAANNNLVEDDDVYLGANSSKTPEVRLLSELLGLNGNPNHAKLKKTNPSSLSFSGPSGSDSTSSNPQAQSRVNENGKRKRVSSDRDEESKSLEIKGSKIVTKKLRTPRHVVNFESEDEIAESTSKAFAKSLKRNNKVKIDHGATPSDVPFTGSRYIGNTEIGGAQSQHSAMQVSNGITIQEELPNDVRRRMQNIDINSIPPDDD